MLSKLLALQQGSTTSTQHIIGEGNGEQEPSFSSSRFFLTLSQTSYVTLAKFFNLFSNSPCAILGVIIPYVRIGYKLIARGFYAKTSK